MGLANEQRRAAPMDDARHIPTRIKDLVRELGSFRRGDESRARQIGATTRYEVGGKPSEVAASDDGDLPRRWA